MFAEFYEDIRYAVRGLQRDVALAVTVAATLAIAIGANTTVFSLADSILIRPLPYPGAERIHWISEVSGPAHEDIGAAPDYYSLRDENRVFEDVAAFDPLTVTWTGVENPEQLDAASVSVSFFRVMGTQALLGRYLAAGEGGSKAPQVVVLSYAFWRNQLGGDPGVVGKTIAFDRQARTIVGVMPQGFDFPRATQVWIPLGVDESSQRPIVPTRLIFVVSILARAKPGVSPRELETEMNRLTYAIRAEYPPLLRGRGFRSDLTIAAVPLQQHMTGGLRPALLVLTGAVGLVLLIACVNVANLLLVRAAARTREVAVRVALGASRGRVIRQVLTEGLVLALPGGIAGMAIAEVAVFVLDAIKPAILVRYPPISMDARVLLFTFALTVATGVAFGMAPALSAAAIHIHEALKSARLTHSLGRGSVRLRKLLVAAELAISLVLLIGAGMLARSFLKLASVEMGFSTDHMLTFRVNRVAAPAPGVNSARFYQEILDRLQEVPMARSVALLTDIPLSGGFGFATGRIRVVGRPPLLFTERPLIENTVVSRDFFRTMEVPLKRGRLFDAHDASGSVEARGSYLPSETVLVNEAFARRILPGEEPVGQRLGFGPDERQPIWTIVGVVGDVRGDGLGAEPPPLIYRCTCLGIPVFSAGFAIRTAEEPKSAIRFVERQVRMVDRDQTITDVKTMEERKDAALAPQRFELVLIGAFAAIAILLAVAGIYGVMSYLVTRRTREIGIRVAMGARPADVVRMVLGETGILVLAAAGGGIAGAMGLTRFLQSMLYGITELDAATFALATVLIAAIVVFAAIGPARRAARIDPAVALRDE
jgi:predicted permease